MWDGRKVCFPIGITEPSLSTGSCTNTSLQVISIPFFFCFRCSIHFVGTVEAHMLSSINREAEVTSTVEANLVSVDVDCCFVVYCCEVEQYLSSGPRRWDCERCGEPGIQRIPSLNSCTGMNKSFLINLFDILTREATLQTRRYQNFICQRFAKRRRVGIVYAGSILICPDSNQILPIRSFKLRSWILGPRVGANFIRPVCRKWRLFDCIFGRSVPCQRCRCQQRHEQQLFRTHFG